MSADTQTNDLYRVNDALTALAAEFQVDTSTDNAADKLNELTHQFAEVFEITPRPTLMCPRHGGDWGGDPTCEACTNEVGEPTPTPTRTPAATPSHTIPVPEIEPGMVLVGERGGRTEVTGKVGPSSSMPGCFRVEVEHGALHLDQDGSIEVLVND